MAQPGVGIEAHFDRRQSAVAPQVPKGVDEIFFYVVHVSNLRDIQVSERLLIGNNSSANR